MTRTFHDPECGRILSAPLADTESAARAVLAYDPAPICADMGGDSLAEHFRPSSCNRNCVQGRMCDCVADVAEDRRATQRTEDFGVFRGLRNALLISAAAVGIYALGTEAVAWLSLRLETPIDRPAPASQPTTTPMKGTK